MRCDIRTGHPVLYKYMSKAGIKSTLASGLFRIGTLYEYRDYENQEIGDKSQGLKQYILPASETLKGLSTEVLKARYPLFRNVKGENFYGDDLAETVAKGAPVALTIQAPDCFLYCMTTEFHPDIMKRFGYEVCLEIRAPEKFFAKLSKSMSRFANYGVIENCKYGSQYEEYEKHNQYRPQILKDSRLAYQREVRILWDPRPRILNPLDKHAPLRPIYLRCPAALKYCRQIA